MGDDTFNFMMFLKLHHPKAHDHFVSMLFMGINQGKKTFDHIWSVMEKPYRFKWQKSQINLFEIRTALQKGEWASQTWSNLKLTKQKGGFYVPRAN